MSSVDRTRATTSVIGDGHQAAQETEEYLQGANREN
jgi:hypothetical protein